MVNRCYVDLGDPETLEKTMLREHLFCAGAWLVVGMGKG